VIDTPATEPLQLGLAIRLDDAATFTNFYCVEESRHTQVVETLAESLISGAEPFVYLWGASGTGISHLLQAACHRAAQQNLQAQYLPLLELLEFPPQQLLENMEQLDLVCVDNLQCIAGDKHWQQALFDFYNRVRESGGRLLVGADCAPRELPLTLADLQSRLSWGPVFQLPLLSDDDKVAVLQFRADRRGIEFGADPARFLIRRSGRCMAELIEKLDFLEQAAIENQRILTIPFLKETFGW